MVEVLWVKGSGGDSASIKLDGFSTLYMDKLRALKDAGLSTDKIDEVIMVGGSTRMPAVQHAVARFFAFRSTCAGRCV